MVYDAPLSRLLSCHAATLEFKESPNAYKFEAFLFDAFGEVDEMAVLRVKREEEFAPVKNADSAGVDCPRTARELYKKFYNLD